MTRRPNIVGVLWIAVAVALLLVGASLIVEVFSRG